jgi:hypothetical protein
VTAGTPEGEALKENKPEIEEDALDTGISTQLSTPAAASSTQRSSQMRK